MLNSLPVVPRLLLAACALFFAIVAQGANKPPQISGTPASVARVGALYSFQPSASDPEGARLKFKITGKPGWAAFNASTGKLSGTPVAANIGNYGNIRISVSDGRYTASLAPFSITVAYEKKATYGHYFSTRYLDTPSDAAMLCEQAGVRGVVWRRTWGEVETAAGIYDFGAFDAVLAAIAASANPQCQLWVFIEYKSFSSSPIKNPCPAYLQAQYSALNSSGNGAMTCFMWEPVVISAYTSMINAAAARYDANPRVEGVIFQESALGFSGDYSQDVANGGTYTAEAWRDGLINLIGQCGARVPAQPMHGIPEFPAGRPELPVRRVACHFCVAGQPRMLFGSGPASRRTDALYGHGVRVRGTRAPLRVPIQQRAICLVRCRWLRPRMHLPLWCQRHVRRFPRAGAVVGWCLHQLVPVLDAPRGAHRNRRRLDRRSSGHFGAPVRIGLARSMRGRGWPTLGLRPMHLETLD